MPGLYLVLLLLTVTVCFQGVSLLGERQYEEALDVFMEGLVIAERQRLADRILSTFHDHVAHTILQLRQQRALHTFALVSSPWLHCCTVHASSHLEVLIYAISEKVCHSLSSAFHDFCKHGQLGCYLPRSVLFI